MWKVSITEFKTVIHNNHYMQASIESQWGTEKLLDFSYNRCTNIISMYFFPQSILDKKSLE